MLRLCSIALIFSSIVPALFFNYQRGGFRNSAPPPLQISDSKQRKSIVLQFFSIVPVPFFNFKEVIYGEFWDSIVLKLCSTVLQFLSLVPTTLFMTQSLEIEFCGILFENCGLVLRDTKLDSPENSSRSQNLRIRSLELKESIECLLFDTEGC